MADPFFEGWKGVLQIGDAEIPVDGPPVVSFERGSAPWPTRLPLGGGLRFEGSFPVEIDLDAWAGLRGAKCPSCGVPWAELPAGHTWTSADGGSCRDAEP